MTTLISKIVILTGHKEAKFTITRYTDSRPVWYNTLTE